MCKRWMGGALLAVWLGLAVVARAQYLPTLPGSERTADAAPAKNGAAAPAGDVVADPLAPLAVPPLPGPDAPAGPDAGCGCAPGAGGGGGCHIYGGIGALGLQRSRLTAADIAILDPNPRGSLPSGTQLSSSGVPLGQPQVQNFRDVLPPMAGGFRATAGVLWDNQAIEVSGWYITPSGSTDIASFPRAVDTLFFNQPVGFASGLHSDTLTTIQNTRLFNVEANYRKYCCVGGLEFLGGVRYLQVRDALNIETIGSTASPVLTGSNYVSDAYNHLITGQVGLEYNLWLLSWLSVGVNGKAALGANIINTNVSLTRPDGYIGFNSPHHNVSLGQIYEIGGYVDIHCHECFRIRGGYITLWLENVATSVNQVDFNLRGNAPPGYNFQQAGDYTRFQPHGLNNNFGGMFFNGPMVEAQFLF